MSKITRKLAKVFGLSAGLNQIAEFGSFAAASPAYSTDPDTIQSLSNWLTGWFGAVVGANSPAIEDMNAFCYVMSYQIAYALQTGVAEWNSDTTYYIGSLVNDGGGNLYVSLQDGNASHALTVTAWWRPLIGGSTVTVSASSSIGVGTGLLRSNSTGADRIQTLPAIATCYVGQRITVKDVGSGAHVTSVKGNGAELIDGANTYGTTLSQYDSLTVACNGTTWDVI